MHELPVIDKILQVALKHARKNNISRILSIHLEIGELSDLEESWLQRYFDRVSSGTPAAGAALNVTRIPVSARCSCGNTFGITLNNTTHTCCPSCGSSSWQLVAGKGYFVKSMEGL